jgi:hypothetical protein
MVMIWFTCKQCGKVHGRPEAAAGATIFCACGTGLLVPWESTAPPPEPPAVPIVALPAESSLDPAPFAPPTVTPAKTPRARKRRLVGPRDPQVCFNHDDIPKKTSCTACAESFCGDCLVVFEGESLCGPCKNYRVKSLQRVPPASSLSIFSATIALLTAPVTLGLVVANHAGLSAWTFMALVPQAVAAGLAILALRPTLPPVGETGRGEARDPPKGGMPLALTGLATACVTTILIFLAALYAPPIWT